MIVLSPALTRPTIAIAIAIAAVAGWLAWRSVAYPLALAGIPTIITAIVGYDPLPKGGVTFILAAWIGLAVVFTFMRGERRLPGHLLVSAPVALSLLLLGLMILRLSPSPGEEYGSMKTQLFVADNLVFFMGALFVGSRRSDLRLFLLLVLAVTAGGALLLLFELVSGSARAVVGERFSLGAQEYPIYLARSSADGLMIATYTILTASSVKARLWAITVFPVLVIAMIAAGSKRARARVPVRAHRSDRVDRSRRTSQTQADTGGRGTAGSDGRRAGGRPELGCRTGAIGDPRRRQRPLDQR